MVVFSSLCNAHKTIDTFNMLQGAQSVLNVGCCDRETRLTLICNVHFTSCAPQEDLLEEVTKD